MSVIFIYADASWKTHEPSPSRRHTRNARLIAAGRWTGIVVVTSSNDSSTQGGIKSFGRRITGRFQGHTTEEDVEGRMEGYGPLG